MRDHTPEGESTKGMEPRTGGFHPLESKIAAARPPGDRATDLVSSHQDTIDAGEAKLTASAATDAEYRLKDAVRRSEQQTVRTEAQAKGDELEQMSIEKMEQIPGMVTIYEGAKSHGFDPCFWHPDRGVIIADSKNFGNAENPGYVTEVHALSYERCGKNLGKMLADIEANDRLPQQVKDSVRRDLIEQRGMFLVIGGDHTRMTAYKQQQLLGESGRFSTLRDLKSTFSAGNR